MNKSLHVETRTLSKKIPIHLFQEIESVACILFLFKHRTQISGFTLGKSKDHPDIQWVNSFSPPLDASVQLKQTRISGLPQGTQRSISHFLSPRVFLPLQLRYHHPPLKHRDCSSPNLDIIILLLSTEILPPSRAGSV